VKSDHRLSVKIKRYINSQKYEKYTPIGLLNWLNSMFCSINLFAIFSGFCNCHTSWFSCVGSQRIKRQTMSFVGTHTVCRLVVVADYYFYQNLGQRNRRATGEYIVSILTSISYHGYIFMPLFVLLFCFMSVDLSVHNCFRSFSSHWLHLLKWNVVHWFIIIISRSSSVLGTIEPFLLDLCPLDFEKFQ
jgi:hypothetical protein